MSTTPSTFPKNLLLNVFIVLLVAAAIFQGCRGHATDSEDPGTSAGNDTITVIDRYGSDTRDDYMETPGSGNTTEGYDSTQGGNTGSVGSSASQGPGNNMGVGTAAQPPQPTVGDTTEKGAKSTPK